jgi:hypothetical protein
VVEGTLTGAFRCSMQAGYLASSVEGLTVGYVRRQTIRTSQQWASRGTEKQCDGIRRGGLKGCADGPLGRVFLCGEGWIERDVRRTEKAIGYGSIVDQRAGDSQGKDSTRIVVL